MSASRDSFSDQAPYETVVSSRTDHNTETFPPIVSVDGVEDKMFRPKMAEHIPIIKIPFEKKKSLDLHNAQWDATK